MCDDDDDRAAGTVEVTRGGGGDDDGDGGGGGDSWRTGWHRGSQDAASGENGREISRCEFARSPRLVGPMTGHHDVLTARVTPRVVATLASRSRPLLTTLTMLFIALSCCCARASEFPERECCDLPYPIPEPTGRSTSAPTPTGRSGKLSQGMYCIHDGRDQK